MEENDPSSNLQNNPGPMVTSPMICYIQPWPTLNDLDADDEDNVELENCMVDSGLNVERPNVGVERENMVSENMACSENMASFEFDEVEEENMELDFDLELPTEDEDEQEITARENIQWPSWPSREEEMDQRDNVQQPVNQPQEHDGPIRILHIPLPEVVTEMENLDGEVHSGNGNRNLNFSLEELLAALVQFFQGFEGGRFLSEEIIAENLKTKRYQMLAKGQDGKEEEEEICTVCQCEFVNDETIGILECGHEFHAYCITRWLLKKNLCPLCRSTGLVIQETTEKG